MKREVPEVTFIDGIPYRVRSGSLTDFILWYGGKFGLLVGALLAVNWIARIITSLFEL